MARFGDMLITCFVIGASLSLDYRMVNAWITAPTASSTIVDNTRPRTALFAGFGAKSDKKKEIKLKPKQQWDRYATALKKEKPIKVAVKPVDTEEWLEVGTIKSQGGDKTEIAVARQRALIAEHAKRLYPLIISSKVAVEWGHATGSDDWSPVDKSVLSGAPDGVEKIIGFEGIPDPNSGYYCHYKDGRLVNDKEGRMASSDADMRASSKKPQ